MPLGPLEGDSAKADLCGHSPSARQRHLCLGRCCLMRDPTHAWCWLQVVILGHRDIKPGNFMLSSGLLKLSDFGFATFLAKGETSKEDVGTPAYMAPEQHLLKKGSPGYGHPVDVWAAGCTLHMLLGLHPAHAPVLSMLSNYTLCTLCTLYTL